MKGKRFLGHWAGGVLMVLMMCAFLPTEARAASYSDVEGHWAQPAIERWSESGVLRGYEDGRFGPDDPMTRAELATVLYRIWGCQPREGLPYADLDPNAWYYDALTTMEHYEIALGRGDHIYPNEKLTREEACSMIRAGVFGSSGYYEDEGERTPISKVSDWSEISDPYYFSIKALFDKKILNGSDDGKFHPKDSITRAQVITIIDNMFDVYINQPGEYTIKMSDTALVTCGNVKITYTGYSYSPEIYIMASAGTGGVKLSKIAKDDAKLASLNIFGVQEGEQTWVNDGFFIQEHVDGRIKDSTVDLTAPERNVHNIFSGGIGTKSFPYLIENEEQFLYIFTSEKQAKYFSLIDDIELTKAGHNLVTENIKNFSLEGNGHTLTYSIEGDRGLHQECFGLIAHCSGKISNVNFVGTVDVNILDPTTAQFTFDVTREYSIGGLIGSFSGTMENCTSKIDAKVRYTGSGGVSILIGGVIGELNGKLIGCRTEGSVTVFCDGENVQQLLVGGFAGTASGTSSNLGLIEDCTAEGKVTVTEARKTVSLDVGGIAGATYPSKKQRVMYTLAEDELFYQGCPMLRCGSTAEIYVDGGNETTVGGLIGLRTLRAEKDENEWKEAEYGCVENCWSTATITAKNMSFEGDCGGLIGQHWAGVVRNCWAKPVISVENGSYQNVGGIVGKAVEFGCVSDCWAEVSGLDAEKAGETASGSYHYGGIMGRQDNELTNCFVLGNSHLAPENAISYKPWSFADVVNCVDLTNSTAEQRKAFYESCGWDFETVWDNSGVYPILRGCDADAQREAQGL